MGSITSQDISTDNQKNIDKAQKGKSITSAQVGNTRPGEGATEKKVVAKKTTPKKKTENEDKKQ